MDPKCYDKFICAHFPLSEIIGSDEEVFHSFSPAKHIGARIFANLARLYRLIFIILFCILDVILLWFCVPLLIQGFDAEILIFLIFCLTLFNGANAYLILSLLKIDESKYIPPQSSEYLLTNQKLYLKMIRIGPTKKNQAQVCKLRIIDLPLIRSLKYYKSFWDKRYQETGSIKIKLIKPHPSKTLHNLPHPEKIMTALTQVLDSIHHKNL